MEPAPTKLSAPDLSGRPTPKDGPAHHSSEPTRKRRDDWDGRGGSHKVVSASSRGQEDNRGQGGSLASPAGDAIMASSFAGHYGQLIISEGIAPIPRALYLYQGALNLSPQQVWFVSCVLAHKWDGYLPHPSLQEIARHATLGLRQVKKIKNSIVHADLLEVRPRYGSDGEQDANSYDFGMLFDRLERLMLADRSAPEDALAEGSPHVGHSHGLDYVEQSGHGPGVALRETGDPADTAFSATNRREKEKEKGKGKDYSFAARFGRVVLRRGIATVPKALFVYQSQLGLSPQQMWFIGYILSFQWSTELPYPSLRKMASNTGYSERQIHRIKDSLLSAGYLRVIERRAADGADTTSAYDFTALLKSLNALIRQHTSGAKRQAGGANRAATQVVTEIDMETEMEIGEVKGSTVATHAHSAGQASPQAPLEAPWVGGERNVSGRGNSTSVEGEPDDRGRVNSTSGEGVNCASVEGVTSTSYEIESIEEEPDKEEPPQQQATEIAANDQAQEDRDNAYYALVDVGVIPGIALDLASRMEPEQVLDWVRYYLSVLSKQDNLTNPIGVLVSRLRSGEEPPCVPSPGDLQSLRFKLSRYR